MGKLTRIIIVILTVFGLTVIGGGIHSIIRKSFNAGIFALGLGSSLLAVSVVLFLYETFGSDAVNFVYMKTPLELFLLGAILMRLSRYFREVDEKA